MQKLNSISCCAECSSYKKRTGVIPYCAKKDRRIDTNPNSPVNPALVGFPDWCPLESAEKVRIETIDFKKELKHILEIMQKGDKTDSLAEASHYLNNVVEKAIKSS